MSFTSKTYKLPVSLILDTYYAKNRYEIRLFVLPGNQLIF